MNVRPINQQDLFVLPDIFQDLIYKGEKYRDLNELMKKELRNIKDQILSVNYKLMVGRKYNHHLVPNTMYKILKEIDRVEKADHFINILEVINKINYSFQKKINKNNKKTKFIYLNLSSQINFFSKNLCYALIELVKNKIHEINRRMLTSSKYDTSDDEILKSKLTNYIHLVQLVLDKTKNSNTPYSVILGQMIEELMLMINNKKDEIQKSDMEYQKVMNFYQNKIVPYMGAIEKYKNIDDHLDVSQDLESFLKSLIVNYHLITFTVHPGLDEIFVSDGTKTYAFKQILRHNPNVNTIQLSQEELDIAYHLLTQFTVIIPKNGAFPVDYQSLKVNDCQTALDHYFTQKQNTNYTDCHPAHLVAMSAYTGNGYAAINDLFWTEKLSEQMFDHDELEKKSDTNAKAATKDLEFSLRGQNSGDLIDQNEMNHLLKETTLVGLLTCVGLPLVKHSAYNPAKKYKLEGHSFPLILGRTYRGANGSWVSDLLKQYMMAYIGGTPQSLRRIMSTTLTPKIVNNFLNDKADSVVFKVQAFNLDSPAEGFIGGPLNSLTLVDGDENEVSFPPGVALVIPNRRIKNQYQYPEIKAEQKTCIVFVNLNSPESIYYSSKLMDLRNYLIQVYDVFNNLSVTIGGSDEVFKIQELLLLAIHLQASLFKRFDLYVSSKKPDLSDLNRLDRETRGAYILTTDLELYFLNKDENKIMYFKISKPDIYTMIDLLNLDKELKEIISYNIDIKLVSKSLNLTKLNFLKKIAKQPDYSDSYTIDEIILLANQIMHEIHQLIRELLKSKNHLFSDSFIVSEIQNFLNQFINFAKNIGIEFDEIDISYQDPINISIQPQPSIIIDTDIDAYIDTYNILPIENNRPNNSKPRGEKAYNPLQVDQVDDIIISSPSPLQSFSVFNEEEKKDNLETENNNKNNNKRGGIFL